MIKTNTSSTNVTISNLKSNTCYLFGVRGYIVNGYGVWTVIANQTLFDFSTTQPTLITSSTSDHMLNTVTTESILVTPTTDLILSTSTMIVYEGKIKLMKYGFTFIIDPNKY